MMNDGAREKRYLDVEDLDVYQRLCLLHIEICDITHLWPREETYEIGSQIRRSSNSSPAQLAEKHDDRHVRNKIEGINRSRGEAGETIHHLHIARLKHYVTDEVYGSYRNRYRECIRMLNGLEKALERHLPTQERRWVISESHGDYLDDQDTMLSGWPEPLNTEPLNTEPLNTEPLNTEPLNTEH